MHSIPNYTLSNGLVVPKIGFGTDKLKGSRGLLVIKQALNNGYRFLDTAYNYENEATVGKAVRESGLAREEVLISSKLPERYHAYDLAIPAIQESLYRADLDYYDLYLIHWPDPEQDKYVEAWNALIDAQKFGLIRSIGVSNFHPEHLDRLAKETGVIPVVNQIQNHPHYIQDKLIKGNEKYSILTQPWSPLGQRKADDLLENKNIAEIGHNYGKSIGQVILRWQVQQGFMPIPRSNSPLRQKDNLSIFDFELTQDEMNFLTSLAKPDGDIFG